jgi:hypothetical protein
MGKNTRYVGLDMRGDDSGGGQVIFLGILHGRVP